MSKRTCDVCGKLIEGEPYICSSALGAMTLCYCKDCYENGTESYGDLVSYIACAGHWPNDINDWGKELVRNTLTYLNMSEEQFANDVEEYIEYLDGLWGK